MYKNLSLFYDDYMQDIDYDKWGTYLQRIIDREEVNPREILEYGAGTGEITFQLSLPPLSHVSAVDLNDDMLTIAQNKYGEVKNIDFFKGDMREFNLGKKVDLIVCACDTLNYLTPEEVETFFKKVYNELKPGGLFLFDIVTENYLKDFIAPRTFTYETDDVFFIWNSESYEEFIEYYFTYFIKEGDLYRRIDETQKEYYLKPIFLRKALNKAGFGKTEELEFLTFKDFRDDTDRIQFVVRKY